MSPRMTSTLAGARRRRSPRPSALLASLAPARRSAGSAHWTVITRSAPTDPDGRKVGQMRDRADQPAMNRSWRTRKEPGHDHGHAARRGRRRSRHERRNSAGVGAKAARNCETLPALKCKFVGVVQPYGSIDLVIKVRPEARRSPAGRTKCGWKAREWSPSQSSRTIPGGEAETPFGVEHFELQAEEENGAPGRHGGLAPVRAHDHARAQPDSDANRTRGRIPRRARSCSGTSTPRSPPGLVGNPLAVPQCSDVEFATVLEGNTNACPADDGGGRRHRDLQRTGDRALEGPARPDLQPRTIARGASPLRLRVRESAGHDRHLGAHRQRVRSGCRNSRTPPRRPTCSAPRSPSGASRTRPSHDNARGWECLAGGLTEARTALCASRSSAPAALPDDADLLLAAAGLDGDSAVVEARSAPCSARLLPAAAAGRLRRAARSTPRSASRPTERTASTPTGLTVEVKIPQETTLGRQRHRRG